MWPDAIKHTISWELIRFNQPSQVICVRCSDNPSKSGNDIAQVTVRMHSNQVYFIKNSFKLFKFFRNLLFMIVLAL